MARRLLHILTLQHLLLVLQILFFEWLQLFLEVQAAPLRLLCEINMVNRNWIIDLDVCVVGCTRSPTCWSNVWHCLTCSRITAMARVAAATNVVEGVLCGRAAGHHTIVRASLGLKGPREGTGVEGIRFLATRDAFPRLAHFPCVNSTWLILIQNTLAELLLPGFR